MLDETWRQVREVAATGQNPFVEIFSVHRVIMPGRPRGRPRVRSLDGTMYHYKMVTPGGQPMKCRWFGCNNKMKRDDEAITCSPACAKLLEEYCDCSLKILRGEMPATEFPSYFRSRHLRRRKSASNDVAKTGKKAA